MKIVCPTCNAEYRLKQPKAAGGGATATCKRCGTRIVIESPAAEHYPAVTRPTPETEVPTALDSVAASELMQTYPQLRELAWGRLDLETIFKRTRKGSFKSRQNKLKLKLLQAVNPVLEGILRPDETVKKVAKATAYYPAEIFFGNGWLTVMYNQYVILATERRLLFINVNYRATKTAHYFFQLPYAGIKKVKRGLFGTSLVFARHQARKRVFTGVKRYLAKELRDFIHQRLPSPESAVPAAKLLERLCPSCYLPLPGNLRGCPKCKAAFKLPGVALQRSLLLPGLGDIYLGHRFLGMMELLGSAAIWGFLAYSLVSGVQGAVIAAALVLVFYNGFDALLTFHMGRKGYLLAAEQG